MPESVARQSFYERLTEPPPKAELVVFGVVTALGVAGVLTGVLGPVWYFLTPVLLAIFDVLYNVVRGPSDLATAPPDRVQQRR